MDTELGADIGVNGFDAVKDYVFLRKKLIRK